MTIFGVRLDNNMVALTFLSESNERLQVKSLIKNPHHGKITTYIENESNLIGVIDITLVYPPAWWGGLILLAPIFLFKGFSWSWWYFPGILMISSGIFWTKYFYALISYIGLKKRGYKGTFSIIPNSELLRFIIY